MSERSTDSAPEDDSSDGFIPVRMLAEYVYCPRLFYYEWVESLFAHNRETVEGAARDEEESEGDEGADRDCGRDGLEAAHALSEASLYGDLHRAGEPRDGRRDDDGRKREHGLLLAARAAGRRRRPRLAHCTNSARRRGGT